MQSTENLDPITGEYGCYAHEVLAKSIEPSEPKSYTAYLGYAQDVVIKDAFGFEWTVKDARKTKYGFDIYYGKHKTPSPYEIGGPNRLIYTGELKAFWEKHSLRHDGTIFDLPAGRTTLKRARQAFGFNWDVDSVQFWRKHKADLRRLKPREFEDQFGKKFKEQKLTGERMSFWRFRLLGGKARPFGWWEKPEVLHLLLNEGMSLSQVRAGLSEKISTSQAHRLRRKANRFYVLENGQPVRRPSAQD